jgi:hypothetical protein
LTLHGYQRLNDGEGAKSERCRRLSPEMYSQKLRPAAASKKTGDIVTP